MSELINIYQDKVRRKQGIASWVVSLRADGIKKSGDNIGQQRFHFNTKKEAAEKAVELNAAQKTGGVIMRDKSKTVGAAAEIFIKQISISQEEGVLSYTHCDHLIAYAKQWKDYKIEEGNADFLKDVQCDDVTVGMIRNNLHQFKHKSGKPLTRKSIREKLLALKQIMDIATEAGWTNTINVVSLVKLKNIKYQGESNAENMQLDSISIDKIKSIIAESKKMSGYYGIIISFAAQTGLRFGEQAALKWKHIDFEKKRVSVRLALRKNKFGRVCADIPKTTKRNSATKARRVVFLTDDLVQSLKSWRLQSKFSHDDDFVFCTSRGTTQVTSDNWRNRCLYKVCDKLGIDKIRWHDLRHVFASICLAHFGNDLVRICDLMGHESIETTRNMYGHWIDDPERDEEDANKFEAALFG